MSAPLLGVNAVVKKGANTIGYATSVKVSIDIDLIKAYNIGSQQPVVLEAGNRSFKVSVEKMYIDNAWATDVLNGTKVSIVVQPSGAGTGKPQITLNNVVFNSWDLTIEQDGIIMESSDGEAASITIGTQA
jgi:hypothetical protein